MENQHELDNAFRRLSDEDKAKIIEEGRRVLEHSETKLAGDAYQMLLDLLPKYRTGNYMEVLKWIRSFFDPDPDVDEVVARLRAQFGGTDG